MEGLQKRPADREKPHETYPLEVPFCWLKLRLMGWAAECRGTERHPVCLLRGQICKRLRKLLQENRPSGLIKSHLKPLITWRTPATITIMASEIGKNTFQPSRIN